jgi:hypothetical protein
VKQKSFKIPETAKGKAIGAEMYRRLFLSAIKDLGIEKPQEEYRIYIKGKEKGEHPSRIDFAWEDIKMAVEIEGGVWSGGRHVRGKGYLHDMLKYNWLSLNGWTLLRYTWQTINYKEIAEFYFISKKVFNKLDKLHI